MQAPTTKDRRRIHRLRGVGVYSTGYPRTKDPIIGREVQGVLFAGEDNAVYSRVRWLISRNGMAAQCMDKLRRFTVGQGIQGAAIDQVVNEDRQTVADIDRQIRSELAMFNGAALRIMFDEQGQPERYRVVPFQNVRKTEGGMYSVWGNWGGELDRMTNRGGTPDVYYPFDLSKVQEQAAEYGGMEHHPGQIYCLTFWQYMGSDYPLPPCAPVMVDLDTGSELGVLRNNLVRQGFHQGNVLLLPNKLQPTEREEMSGRIAGMQGSRGAGGCTIIDGVGDTGANPFKAFDRSDTTGITKGTQDQINEAIRLAYGIHPALVEHNKGFSSDDITQAFALLNLETQERRDFIASEMRYVFHASNIEGIQAQSFEVQPLVFTLPPKPATV